MADDISQDAELMAAAQKLMQDRLKLVAEHSANIKAVEEARAALAEREKDVIKSWAALEEVWTKSELRLLKLRDPSKRGPGRPRDESKQRRQRTSNRSSGSGSVPAQSSNNPSEQPQTNAAGSTDV
ncbi:hypothetical protein I5Q34_07430 [Streptomyces sp. AV19]|uniref:hypothetical protein n=1 Tax=Streptomyces sp. AV19 TaxID=2793068 RepID=UPI0018FECE28|nr:hypothetical protein [Streptomyces sp. AV19]MBH1934127.1 hypothetical protein [Streptomyces sp. AV19]MDG4537151.1 hypothetical protein [Streptomyces sp. AV19]